MSDILFIFPTDGAEFHMGIASISAVMKAGGYSTSLCMIHLLHPDDSREKLAEAIRRESPKLVAASVMSCHWEAMKSWLDFIETLTDAPIIVGGWHPTLLPETVIEHPPVDYICLGEGEYPMLDLMHALTNGEDTGAIANLWAKREGRVIRNPLRPLLTDLDRLPDPDRNIFDHQDLIDRGVTTMLGGWGLNKVIPVVFGRGCAYRCGYCCNAAARKRYGVTPRAFVRKRSVEKAIDEIRDLVQTYDARWIEFWDEDLTLDRKWFNAFTEKYPEEINLPFIAMVRPQNILKDEIERLKRANCRVVMMGIESGDAEYRKKYMHRHETNEEIIAAVRKARDAGIAIIASSMIGLPLETEEGVEKTLELNEILQPDFFFFFTYNPFPATEFYDLAVENGLIDHVSAQNYKALDRPVVRGIDPLRFQAFHQRAAEMRARFDRMRAARFPGVFDRR